MHKWRASVLSNPATDVGVVEKAAWRMKEKNKWKKGLFLQRCSSSLQCLSILPWESLGSRYMYRTGAFPAQYVATGENWTEQRSTGNSHHVIEKIKAVGRGKNGSLMMKQIRCKEV